jgi:hypothetical protein
MKAISERDLSVVIPLLFNKIQEMTAELKTLKAVQANHGELTEAQLEERDELLECVDQYRAILDTLRREYESGLAEGINLPSYQELTRVS